MFDFHMHSTVSFDGKSAATDMVCAAVNSGLKEICFTDHLDYDPFQPKDTYTFQTEDYNRVYEGLHHPDLKIRLGFEFGMLPDNAQTLKEDLKRRNFDFVLGSVHLAESLDIYFPPYWEGKTVDVAEQRYFAEVLTCVQNHNDFDVLGHLTYPGKVASNPTHRPVSYGQHKEVMDEIFKVLISKGKGIEVNTSGKDICGAYLPDVTYLRRFKELGGEIVTVGSDAHNTARVGQYCFQVCKMVQEIFGHVCTFENRRPIFHK